eukprot:TRINITY_DN62714_c0_g1_i1.p1 TRINITY_DN62714_c0_g1~~TRINITY_DN62714_c0_g1_i1.p1  ORF type:complete len:349 (+),score=87.37 TRINITY_DN62714_c0_g1_i1:124-1170(+)
MPPKKKGDEETPPPEECLPEGYSIGCEVYLVCPALTTEAGETLKTGCKGRLTEAKSVAEVEKEDGGKGFAVDVVVVEFNGAALELPIASISLEPPPLEILDELSTGLRLPLTGVQVKTIWAEHGDPSRQAELIEQLLGLEEAFPSPAQRLIVADLFLFTLAHARSICAGPVQGAVLLAITDRLLARMRGPQEVSVGACFEEYERLILQHSCEAPPERLALLSGSEVRLLTDFVTVTLFKQFRLYQYCINVEREVHTLHFFECAERPQPPPDLNTAKPRKQRSKETPSGAEDLAAQDLEGAGEQEAPADPDSEIDRLVQEKLKETERRLQARLADREHQFRKRLEARKK